MLLRWITKLWPFGRKTPSAGNTPAGGGNSGTGQAPGGTVVRPDISGPEQPSTGEGNTSQTTSGPAVPGMSNSAALRSQLLSQLSMQKSRRASLTSPALDRLRSFKRPPPLPSSNPNRSDDDGIALGGFALATMGTSNPAMAAAAAAPLVGSNSECSAGASAAVGEGGGVSPSCDTPSSFSGGGGDSGGAGASGSTD